MKQTARECGNSQITLNQPFPPLFHLRTLPLPTGSQSPRAFTHHPLDLFPDDLEVPAEYDRVQTLLLSILSRGFVEVLLFESGRDRVEDLLLFGSEFLNFGL